ncbi:MAG: hypothetical protein AAGI88_12200 [Pseudomonadota bacterium]
MSHTKTVLLLLLSILGLLALLVLEILRGLAGEDAAAMVIPIGILISVTALPVVLLTLWSARWTVWLSMLIATLMSLFHLAHLVEHLVAFDVPMPLLILVTMLIPSVAAVVLLWRGRSTT